LWRRDIERGKESTSTITPSRQDDPALEDLREKRDRLRDSKTREDGEERIDGHDVAREEDLLRAVVPVVEHGKDEEDGDAAVDAVEGDGKPR
jgi:hypothetical protein